jgi:hypothetical protein
MAHGGWFLAASVIWRIASWKDLDKEVDGVAGLVAMGPAPITVFDDQAWLISQLEVVGGPFDKLQAPLSKQRQERSDSGGADLLPAPAGMGFWIRRAGCHTLFSSEVG